MLNPIGVQEFCHYLDYIHGRPSERHEILMKYSLLSAINPLLTTLIS